MRSPINPKVTDRNPIDTGFTEVKTGNSASQYNYCQTCATALVRTWSLERPRPLGCPNQCKQ